MSLISDAKIKAALAMFGGKTLPDKIDAAQVLGILKFLDIKLPAVEVLGGIIQRLADLKAQDPSITVERAFADPDLTFLLRRMTDQKVVARCPGCGYTEMVGLLSPRPCSKCGAERVSSE